ncbi:AAA family ATPase [bacterium]|nr:AAA family ATPase [bacterium]
MRIKRIEIFGFKSFLERFSLTFDQPMIGIIGPNGCGKSNVVDSLRWVLGETNARQLRGSTLEDLIFNGTQTRRPLGMVEVSLTLKNSEPALSSHAYTQQTQSNVVPLRPEYSQPEFQEATAELGASTANSVELSSSFKEAFPELLSAAEIELTRRLYRSGESEYLINKIPCRLRDFIEFYRVLGLGPRALSIVEQGQVGDVISRKPQELRELIEETAGIAGFRAKIEVSERELRTTAQNILRLEDILREVEKQVATLRRQAKRLENRKRLQEELVGKENDLFNYRSATLVSKSKTARERVTDLTDQLDKKTSELNQSNQTLTAQEAELTALEDRLKVLRFEYESIVSELENRRENEHARRIELAQAEAELKSMHERSAGIGAKIQTLSNERDAREKVKAEASLKLANLVAERERVLSRRAERDFEVSDKLRIELQDLSGTERSLTEQLEALKIEIAQCEGEIQAFENHLREGLSRSADDPKAKELLSHVLEAEGLQSVYALITVPAEYERALAACLAEKTTYFVTHDVQRTAKAHGENLKMLDLKVGFVGKSSNTFTDQDSIDRVLEAYHGVVQLSKIVKIETGYSEAIKPLLEHAFVVKDTNQAFDLIATFRAENIYQIFCVTPDGVRITETEWSLPDRREALLSLRRLQDEKQQLRSKLGELVIAKEAERSETTQLVLRLREEITREEERLDQAYTEELNRLSSEIGSLEGLANFETKRNGELGLEISSLQNDLAQISSTIGNLSALLAPQMQHTDHERSLEELNSQRDKLHQDLEQFETKRQTLRENVVGLRLALDQQRRERDEIYFAHNQEGVALERFDVQGRYLVENMLQKYEGNYQLPSLETALSLLDGIEPNENYETSLEEEIQNIGRRLEREGGVDPEVADQYLLEKDRFEKLELQYTDLKEAKTSLEKTIAELREISSNRFIETFESVRGHFEDLVPRLFGGGSGTIELVGEGDLFSKGVQISVRPPGKKLRSLELMSGGEKALSATALLLAMFLHRPTPICVLDEVDAPLDDANLERFLRLIREISDRTNFLIITHNHASMSAMDRLIGITMQEKGVTKALSVTLDQAVETLEQAQMM